MATTPSFVAAGTLVATATNAATIQPVPPNGSIGDFLLLVLERSDNTAAPSVTNWTNVAALTATQSTTQSTACYWRIATSATGSVDQPSAITFGSGTTCRAGVVLRFSGVDPFNPIHQATLLNTASTATTVNATNITSTRDNTLGAFIASMVGARSTTNTTTNWTAGAGVTAFTSQQTTLGGDETIGYGFKTFDVAGSYLSPGIVWTTNTTTGPGQGLLVSLASVGSPPGQSTLDSRRPGAFFAKVFRYPVYDANSWSVMLPEHAPARVQVSWVQIELPDAAAVATLPPGQSTLDSRRPAAYLGRAYRYPAYDGNSGSAFLPEQPATAGIPPGQATLDSRRPFAFAKPPYRIASYDANSVNATIPDLIGQDAMLAGEQRTELPPRSAQRASDYSWTQELLPVLVGQDQMAAGQQFTSLPPRGPLRASDYTWSQEPIPILVGQDQMAAGAQSFVLAPSPASLRARDYSLTASFPLSLIGQDARVAGTQSTDLPPTGPLRARDYSFVPSINLSCLTTVVQQIPYGQQSTDSLPSRGAARARDYTWSQELIPVLVGQDQMATGDQEFDLAPAPAPLRARDYSLAESFPLTLIGQDARVAGTQSTDLPPSGPLRARDYSFTPPINLPALTTVVQQIPYGQQSTDSLPAHAAARARDYTWSQDLIPNLVGQDAVNAGKQSFDLAPSPAPLRARDYSLTESFPLSLIGQDAMTVGERVFDLPPISALRARDYSFVPPINLSCLTTVVQPIPPGQQSTDSLPPHSALRARDYTWTDKFELVLIGQDAMAAGQQRLELSPRAPARASQLSEPGVNFALGLDTLGQKPVGKGSEASALPPKAAARARDYTWLQTAPLYIFQQLPTGQSSQETESPPRGPLRARDYTFLDLTKRHLIGQDAMVVGDTTYASALPPKAYLRSQNLTVPETHNMISLTTTPVRDLAYSFSLAEGHWSFEATDGHWTIVPGDSRWQFNESQE